MTADRSRQPWPKTVDEAVEVVVRTVSPELTETLRAGTRQGAQSRNLSLGLWMRNAFGMWRGNRDLLLDCARRAGNDPPHPRGMDPDRASHFILGMVWDRLEGSAGDDDAGR